MRIQSSAIAPQPVALSDEPARHGTRSGLGWGLLGVLGFSFTMPFTRVAVGGLDPLFIASTRAVVAGLLAAAALAVTRAPLPRGTQPWRLAVVAAGVVVGFPFLTSAALQTSPASHGAVLVGLLPAATAVMAVLRAGERPPRAFWAFAAAGAIVAVVFAAGSATAHGCCPVGLHRSDLLLFGAVLAAAVGYAEGGLLARELGPWQTVSWALVIAWPPMVVISALSVERHPPSATSVQWLALAYLAVVSMYLGFFAWYRGLAIGPMAQVSQVQLVQPVLSILWAGLILGEQLDRTTILGGSAVVGCAALAVRTRRPSTRLG